MTGVSVPVWNNRYGREHQQAQLVLGDSFGVEQFVFIHLYVCVCVRVKLMYNICAISEAVQVHTCRRGNWYLRESNSMALERATMQQLVPTSPVGTAAVAMLSE